MIQTYEPPQPGPDGWVVASYLASYDLSHVDSVYVNGDQMHWPISFVDENDRLRVGGVIHPSSLAGFSSFESDVVIIDGRSEDGQRSWATDDRSRRFSTRTDFHRELARLDAEQAAREQATGPAQSGARFRLPFLTVPRPTRQQTEVGIGVAAAFLVVGAVAAVGLHAGSPSPAPTEDNTVGQRTELVDGGLGVFCPTPGNPIRPGNGTSLVPTPELLQGPTGNELTASTISSNAFDPTAFNPTEIATIVGEPVDGVQTTMHIYANKTVIVESRATQPGIEIKDTRVRLYGPAADGRGPHVDEVERLDDGSNSRILTFKLGETPATSLIYVDNTISRDGKPDSVVWPLTTAVTTGLGSQVDFTVKLPGICSDRETVAVLGG